MRERPGREPRRGEAARQRGVERARAEHASGARRRVAHAVEVDRVFDGAKGMPTVTRDVLPQVTVDLASYSCYDALGTPERLASAILEIRRHARTGPLFGPGAVMLGEIALDATHVIQWKLYCNEPKPGADRCRGFFLVRPDDSPGETGRLFADLWLLAGT
ncbi:hypothetical protein [Planctomyces sp. SH-PL62]|uniref:hypothetical protein n=1 Tax=Planctomyces sp. SH-PL62 TaxID=1636152 RepID=UPI00078C9D39|nr:hypothetical protein [Planctomyces sp. SH-PL62]AMV40834.1 hypothetical protein VT85_25600 [Planctomyces sp. SH-PL62]